MTQSPTLLSRDNTLLSRDNVALHCNAVQNKKWGTASVTLADVCNIFNSIYFEKHIS